MENLVYTLQLLLGPLKTEYLHVTVAIGSPFESRVLTNCSCCWAAHCLEAEYLYITVADGGPFESRILTYDRLRSII